MYEYHGILYQGFEHPGIRLSGGGGLDSSPQRYQETTAYSQSCAITDIIYSRTFSSPKITLVPICSHFPFSLPIAPGPLSVLLGRNTVRQWVAFHIWLWSLSIMHSEFHSLLHLNKRHAYTTFWFSIRQCPFSFDYQESHSHRHSCPDSRATFIFHVNCSFSNAATAVRCP
jgi:hypothetical protein